MRHVRDAADLGSSSSRAPETLLVEAAERAVAAGHVNDDHSAEAVKLALEILPRVKTSQHAAGWLKTTAKNLRKADARERSHLADSEDEMRKYDQETGNGDRSDGSDDVPDEAPKKPRKLSDGTGPSTFFVVGRTSKLERWIRNGGLGTDAHRIETGSAQDGLTVRKVRGIRDL